MERVEKRQKVMQNIMGSSLTDLGAPCLASLHMCHLGDGLLSVMHGYMSVNEPGRLNGKPAVFSMFA